MRRAALIPILCLLSVCGEPSAPRPLDLTGSWSGPGTDRLGPETISLTITQNGNTLWGTAAIRPENPDDGSCVSCHKNKIGSVGGTAYGATIRLTMFFAAGASGDPTPICSITLVGEKGTAGASAIALPYTATDPCEGTMDGTISLTRKP